jgi:hypothetical protein
MSMRVPAIVLAAAVAAMVPAAPSRLAAQSDLDAFMRQVLERRDDNWKKLQQYILDERETIDLRGPAGTTLWGERHDYTWFIRDGYFVRSPVKFNGVTISEADRRKYEAEYLERQQQREKRAQERAAALGQLPAPDPSPSTDAPPTDVDGLIRQTRQPEFISSAYFLRFRFDEGRYALVGRETVENRQALRIEYYPQKLFQDRRPRERNRSEKDESYDREMRRLMNKASRVTLWVDPSAHQILKYTFEDLGWDFLPGQWLVRVDTVRASMTMGEMFEEVWLPRGIDMNVALKLAIGDVDLHYTLDYHDYRRADVTTRIGIPAVK